MEIRVCIDVDDMARAITFYGEGLGLRVGRPLDHDWVEMLGGSSPVDLLRSDADTAPLGASLPQRRNYERHWTPVHLDFVVTDLDAAVARAVAHGARLERPVQRRAWGRMANLSDPFGHGLDLLEFSGRGYDELLDAA
jgi:predicted enzyme related to lactoylglutathione lyase